MSTGKKKQSISWKLAFTAHLKLQILVKYDVQKCLHCGNNLVILGEMVRYPKSQRVPIRHFMFWLTFWRSAFWTVDHFAAYQFSHSHSDHLLQWVKTKALWKQDHRELKFCDFLSIKKNFFSSSPTPRMNKLVWFP